MKIVRWNPQINHMRYFNEFERYLERQIDAPGYRGLPLDVAESEEGYVVKASVPGINPDDVEITIEEDVLTIKGDYVNDSETEEETYLIRERRVGGFGRSIRFPVEVNAEAVGATYENGVLTLNVPKVEEVKPKRVEIKVS